MSPGTGDACADQKVIPADVLQFAAPVSTWLTCSSMSRPIKRELLRSLLVINEKLLVRDETDYTQQNEVCMRLLRSPILTLDMASTSMGKHHGLTSHSTRFQASIVKQLRSGYGGPTITPINLHHFAPPPYPTVSIGVILY